MEINRFNTFYIIHKALRAMLYDTAVTLQQSDFTNRDEAKASIDKNKLIVEYYGDHAGHEDTFLMPMIEKFDAKTVKEFESEHVTDHRLGREMIDLTEQYNSAKTSDEQKEIGLNLLYSFNEFMGFNLYHMNKEEDILNKILWEHYTDPEILEMQGRLVRSIPTEKNMVFVAWMFKSISNNEVIGFLQFQSKVQPPELYSKLVSLAENLITSNRWDQIKKGLPE